jgi:hypothetical protein
MGIEIFLLEEAATTSILGTGGFLMNRYRGMQRIKQAVANDPSELIRRIIKLQAKGNIESRYMRLLKRLETVTVLGHAVRQEMRFNRHFEDTKDYMFPGRRPNSIRVDERPDANGSLNVNVVLDYGNEKIVPHSYATPAAIDSLHSAKEFLRSMGYSIGLV